jgi:hypothetical protein
MRDSPLDGPDSRPGQELVKRCDDDPTTGRPARRLDAPSRRRGAGSCKGATLGGVKGVVLLTARPQPLAHGASALLRLVVRPRRTRRAQRPFADPSRARRAAGSAWPVTKLRPGSCGHIPEQGTVLPPCSGIERHREDVLPWPVSELGATSPTKDRRHDRMRGRRRR